MDMLGRRLGVLEVGGVLLGVGLTVSACSGDPRNFGAANGGSAGEHSSSAGASGGARATAGSAGASAGSSRGGQGAGGRSASEAGTGGQGADGSSGAASGGAAGTEEAQGGAAQAGAGKGGSVAQGGMAQAGAGRGGAPQGGSGGAAQAGSGGAVSRGGSAGVGNGGGGGKPAVCGDSVVQSPTEQCDDGNTVTEACSYGQKSCTVCDATCHSAMGSTSYCGDSAVRSGYETCDDGNTVTEACTYGQASCTVCDSTCHSIAGAISYCGDSVRQAAREACDNGASNSINGNCSPTCTTCDKVPGSEPVTYDDVAWTGGVSFTVTQATTLHQFKVYHHDVSYRLYLYQLAAPDTAPAVDALPVWVMPAIGLPFATPNAPTFDTIDVSLPLSAGTSYLLSTVGQVMVGTITNPATDYPAQSLSGIKVSKAFSVGDTLELNQGTFSTNFWGPFTDLRSCLQSPN